VERSESYREKRGEERRGEVRGSGVRGAVIRAAIASNLYEAARAIPCCAAHKREISLDRRSSLL